MATTDRWIASLTVRDGVLRDSVIQFYVGATDAKAYIAAADAAARAATAVGVLFAKTLAMTDAVEVQQHVGLEQVQDSPSNPADTVLRGNKLHFQYNASARKFGFSIPARKAASFTQSPDSLQVSLSTPTAMSDFVTAVQATALSIDGGASVVQRATIVD